MENVLSKEETDALLKGIDEGDVETGTGTSAGGRVREYDFAEQNTIIRGRLPVLERLNERLARTLTAGLRTLLKHELEVTPGGLRSMKQADYLRTLNAPSSLSLLAMRPLPGLALLSLDPALVYLSVDSYFGGAGRAPAKLDGRDFTPGETRVIELLRTFAIARLGEAWDSVKPLRIELTGSDSNPQFVDLGSAGQTVIISSFEVAFEGAGGELQIAYPQFLLEPVRELLDGGAKVDDESQARAWNEALRARLEDTELQLSAGLARLTLELREVLRIKPGDVIPIELEDTITVVSGGTPLFRARFGASRGRNAVMLTGHIDADTDEDRA